MVQGRPGRPPFAAKREQFGRLIARGVGSAEACRIVGVHPKTGKRWRLGRAVTSSSGARLQYAPVVGTRKQVISERFLSEDDRVTIADLRGAGFGVRAIAAQLGRSPSTVSREIGRNGGRGVYRAVAAQARADARAARPKTAKLAGNGELRAWVQGKLEANWSPEQISAMLVAEFGGRPEMRVSHETIYQALYVQGRGALRRELARHLRTGRALRRPRRKDGERRGKIPGMVNISERPAEAQDRAVPGHWEGDLIIGTRDTAIGTLVERSTRFVLLLHLPAGHDTAAVADAMTAAMGSLPAQLRRSLAWDQGKEMTGHARISLATGLDIYFCDPHSPWQRGSNENTNGLLRQYFPKGTDLRAHSREHLEQVAAELNSRPRKTLGWKTPAQALDEFLAAAA